VLKKDIRPKGLSLGTGKQGEPALPLKAGQPSKALTFMEKVHQWG